jgi:hypothetical protein
LGSECVDWLYEVVWPLCVMEDEDEEVDWKVELELVVVGAIVVVWLVVFQVS